MREGAAGDCRNDIRKRMGAVFGDEGGRAGGCHGGFEIRVVLSRDSNHMDIWKRLFDPLSGLDSIRSRHFHIHDDDVRNEANGHFNGFISVCGLTDDD